MLSVSCVIALSSHGLPSIDCARYLLCLTTSIGSRARKIQLEPCHDKMVWIFLSVAPSLTAST